MVFELVIHAYFSEYAEDFHLFDSPSSLRNCVRENREVTSKIKKKYRIAW